MKTHFFTLIFCFLIIWPLAGLTQEPLEHQERIYTSAEGRLYIQKSMPVYLRIATSPDEDAKSYLLKSEETSSYSNPMYFDTEGWNTVRSPSAVDTSSKEVTYPLQDIIFEVYADSKAPQSDITLPDADYRNEKGMMYFSEGVNFELTAQDALSGLEKIYYSMDGEAYRPYEQKVTCKEEKTYHIQYYSVDHVRNVEKPHSVKFVVDQTAPSTTYSIEGDNKKNILGNDSYIQLSSEDSLSGVKEIHYSINDGEEKVYEGPISVRQFEDTNNELVYYAVDHVGNAEDKQSLTSSLKKQGDSDNGGGSFSYYIDREAPEVELRINGDQYSNQRLYVSRRSKVELAANDDKSGVKQITYSINNSSLSNIYSEPFHLDQEGIQYVSYAAEDQVNNFSGRKTRAVFMDTDLPEATFSLEGRHYKNRDTLFIKQSTQISLKGEDKGSGLEKTLYRIDQNEWQTYEKSVTLQEPGFHIFGFRAVDRVNNKQQEQTLKVYVDQQAPEIYHHFSVKSIGTKTVRDEAYTIYPSNCRLYMAATDMACGTDRIRYRINGGEWETKIPLPILNPGNYEVQIQANDYLGNQASRSVKFAIEH